MMKLFGLKLEEVADHLKKKGEQEAARQALLYYEVINENSDDEGDEYEEIN